MTDNKNIIIVFEIGSSALRVAAAEVHADNVNILDSESSPIDQGVRYGRIQNLEDVATAARHCLDAIAARHCLGSRQVVSVYVTVGGRSMKAIRTGAELRLPVEGEISQEILDRLVDMACADIPDDYKINDIIPSQYIVDGMEVKRPIGNMASSISAQFTIVCCNERNIRNIETLVTQRLNLDIADWITRPLAEGRMALTDSERKGGCMLVDLGAETTTVSIYKNDILCYLDTIPMGAETITNDIAVAMSVSEEEARTLKEHEADITAQKGADVTANTLNTIVSDRTTHIIANIIEQIKFAGFKAEDLAKGIVITGGGSLLRHFGTRLAYLSRMTVRSAANDGTVSYNDSALPSGANFPLVASVAEAARLARSANAKACVSEPVAEPEPVKPEPKSDEGGIGNEDDAPVFGGGQFGPGVPPGRNYQPDDEPTFDDEPEQPKPKKAPKHEQPEKPHKPSRFSSIMTGLGKRFTGLMSSPDGKDDFDDEK